MPKQRIAPWLLFLSALSLTPLSSADDDDGLAVIELKGIEVFSKSMKIIDGFTGKAYEGDHPTVIGFRREFDRILTDFHKELLVNEARMLALRTKVIDPFAADLSQLAQRFGMKEFSVKGPHFTREWSIFRRMAKDPFFNIEELVVWNLAEVKWKGPPDNKYAKDIRFDESAQQWERRIQTKWEVDYVQPTQNNLKSIYTFKEQGLNLDTKKGYHLIEIGLRPDVPPHAFKEVKLYYPIFFNTGKETIEEIEWLSEDFRENLSYIYDPFSWVARGNVRFRNGFHGQLKEHLSKERLPVTNRDWFEEVFAHLLNDIVTIKYWGVDSIYNAQMLASYTQNRNILGQGLDLLNWHPREKRKVNYDPNKPHRAPRIDFENPRTARFILLDAYRRYGDALLEAIRERLASSDGKVDAKEMLRQSLEQVSGVPADTYIPAASRAQKKELERFQRRPQ